MIETIDLSDLSADMVELSTDLLANLSIDSVSFHYNSDNGQLKNRPAPFELKVAMTKKVKPQYFNDATKDKLYRAAAETLLKYLRLTATDSVQELVDVFAAITKKAGDIWYFVPDETNFSIRLVYKKLTFELKANPNPLYVYSLE